MISDFTAPTERAGALGVTDLLISLSSAPVPVGELVTRDAP